MVGANVVRWLAIVAVSLSSLILGSRQAFAGAPEVIVNPVRVTVPAIGVDASVQDVGLADDGSMGVPVGFSDVAYYTLGFAPGQDGYAAFTGHISSTEFPGVFYNIDELAPGNTVHIFGEDGSELVFIVQDVETYDADDFPTSKIFAPRSTPGLVLITCTGDWDPVAHLFADRVVVYADLASS